MIFHCSRILCDTGESNKPDYITHLKKVLKDEQATISDIILTHWHYDHIGGVKEVLQCLDNANGLPLPPCIFPLFTLFNHESIKLLLFSFFSDCNIWKYPRTDADDVYPEYLSDLTVNTLENEQIFNTDGCTLKVVHTPGHTTDHCILFVNETKEIFSGDCILGEGTAVFEDLFDYMKSLDLIINENPITIYPGHGNIVTVSFLIWWNYVPYLNV